MSAPNTINVAADADAENCFEAAVNAFVAEYPDLRGYDLSPEWADDDREQVTLTLPAWFDVEARVSARG